MTLPVFKHDSYLSPVGQCRYKPKNIGDLLQSLQETLDKNDGEAERRRELGLDSDYSSSSSDLTDEDQDANMTFQMVYLRESAARRKGRRSQPRHLNRHNEQEEEPQLAYHINHVQKVIKERDVISFDRITTLMTAKCDDEDLKTNKTKEPLLVCGLKCESEMKLPSLRSQLTPDSTVSSQSTLSQRQREQKERINDDPHFTSWEFLSGLQVLPSSEVKSELQKCDDSQSSCFLMNKPNKIRSVFTGEPDLKMKKNVLEMSYSWPDGKVPSVALFAELKNIKATSQTENERISLSSHSFFESNTRLVVKILSVEPDDLLKVQVVSHETELQELMFKMMVYYTVVCNLKRVRVPIDIVKIGMIVAVSVGHGTIVRARILKKINAKEFCVESVDDNKQYEVHWGNIFYLPIEFLEFPFLVNRYQLTGLDFFHGTGIICEDFTESAVNLQKVLSGIITVKQAVKTGKEKLFIELFMGEKKDGKNINQEFRQWLLTSLNPLHTISTDSLEKGFYTYRWNKSGVYWIRKESKLLTKMMNCLNQNGYKLSGLKEETLASLSEGFMKNQVYVTLVDELFYRAKVLDIIYKENKVVVEFIDVGTIEKICIKGIYLANSVDENFANIPSQCFTYCLDGTLNGHKDRESNALKQNIPVQLMVQCERIPGYFVRETLRVFVEMEGDLISLEDWHRHSQNVSFNYTFNKMKNYNGLSTVGEYSILTRAAVKAHKDKLKLEKEEYIKANKDKLKLEKEKHINLCSNNRIFNS